MNTHLLIIDPQKDFCSSAGSLYVEGAEDDSLRLASFIKAIKHQLEDIHVTLDTHHFVSIFHPVFWIDSRGANPTPFTIISYDDVKSGKWSASNPVLQKWAQTYTKALQDNKRYALCIWPYHCLIGSDGHRVMPPIYDALKEWELQFANVDYVTKGTNYLTEHYSAVQADVVVDTDPTTQLQTGKGSLIRTLAEADLVLLSGQALSHCVAFTVSDIADNFGEENIKKMVLIEDTTSTVTDPPGTTMFTDAALKFLTDMKARGMRTCRSTDIDFISQAA